MMSKDENNIKRIREETEANFFVEAGAGSGKTRALVDRMVAMVENGTPIEHICAITFTRAAASEFYSRFQEELSKSESEYAEEALNNIDLCFMGTIDAFCNMIISEYPIDACVPTDSGILSDEEMMEEFIHEFSMISNGEYGDELLEKYHRARELNDYKMEETFVSALFDRMNMRSVEFHYEKPKKGSIDDIFADEIRRIRDIVGYLKDHPGARYDSNKGSREAWDSIEECYTLIRKPWQENLYNVTKSLTVMNGLRIIPDYEKRMDEMGPGWEHFFKSHTSGKNNKLKYFCINEEEDPLLEEAIQDQKYAVMMDLVDSSVGSISEKLRQQGKFSFFDYLLYTRELLKNDIDRGGKLIRHLTGKYKYFLIDEFQDTDPIQGEIFFYLAAETPKKDWMKCKPRPGSLFVVGDPKQSIYRFRNADIESYKKVKTLFENGAGEVLSLAENHRSTEKLKCWFNDVFGTMLIDSHIQAGFEAIPCKPSTDNGYDGVLDGAFKYLSGKPDPDKVAEIIAGLVDDEQIGIIAKDKSRPIQYKDFMVLTYTKAGIGDHMRKMREMGIPFRVAGKVLFGECPALVAISRMLKYLVYRYDADKKAEFAANELTSASFDPDDYRDSSLTPSALFSKLLDHERVLAKVGTDNLEYLYYAQELLKARELDGTIYSIKSGADYLERLISGSADTERVLQLKENEDAVLLTNLHKVKGLEAPIVILSHPVAAKRGVSNRRTLTDGYIFNVQKKADSSENKISLISTHRYRSEEENELELIEAEKRRLLYVAATRARNALIVASNPRMEKGIIRVDNSNRPIEKDSNPWSELVNVIDEDIFDVIKAHPDETDDNETEPLSSAEVAELYERAEKEACLSSNESKRKKQNEDTYIIERPSTLKKTGAKSQKNNTPVDDSEEAEVRKTSTKGNAALMGTMVHRLMEMLVLSETIGMNESAAGEFAEGAIDEIKKEHEDELTEGVNYDEALGEVADKILSGGYSKQDPGVPVDILPELLDADEVYCELPFCYREPPACDGEVEKIWHGVMDVVYKKDGAWHILDYKTNFENDALGDEYRAQLDAYVDAFRTITGETADAKIYSIPV